MDVFLVCSMFNDHVGLDVFFLVCSMFNDHVGLDVFCFVQCLMIMLVWMFFFGLFNV
jgi:arginine exporter protein ArgO